MKPIEKAIEERKRRLRELENKQKPKGDYTGGVQYETLKYMGLTNEYQAYRMLGLPWSIREKGTDQKLVLFSKVLKEEKDSYALINWKWKEVDGKIVPDPDWILTRLYNSVLKSVWEKLDKPYYDHKLGRERTAVKKFVNEGTKIFEMLNSPFGNTKKKMDGTYPKYGESFKPKAYVLINVIDKMDDYCKENNHSKILSDYVYEYNFKADNGEQIEGVIANPGIGISSDISYYEKIYDKIIDTFSLRGNNFSDIDCLTTRKKDDKVLDAMDKRDMPDYLKSLVSENPLESWEQNIEMYDFDELPHFKVASYGKLLRNLGFLFKLHDAEIGGKLYDELIALANNEESEKPQTKPVDKKEYLKKEETTNKEEKMFNRRKPVNQSNNSGNDYLDVFPSLNKISADVKELVLSKVEDIEGKHPIWKKEEKKELLSCLEEKCVFPDGTPTNLPEDIMECPVCGLSFLDDDSIPF